MILPDRKIIYIKIPKTASTAVSAAIWDHYGIDRESVSDAAINLNTYFGDPLGVDGWHVDYARIMAHLGTAFAEYTAFSVIRDPLDRTVSVYRWAKSKRPNNSCLRDFPTFLQALEDGNPALPNQARLHARAQIGWLRTADGTLGDIELFDQAHLNDLVPFFETKLGFSPVFETVNRSPRIDVPLDPSLSARVRTFFHEYQRLYDVITASRGLALPL